MLHAILESLLLVLLCCCILLKSTDAFSLSLDARKFLMQLRTDYILYGITQDCRVFFIRPKNLDLFSEMRVNNTVNLCAPEYIKWHYYQPKDKFLLTRKVAGKNEFCALSVEKPTKQTLMNTHKFDYSAYPVINDNMFCVHLKAGNFSFESDSSFISAYHPSVLYIVNIRTYKNEWEILPLQALENGELKKHGRSGAIPQESWGLEGLPPSEILIEIDATRLKRYVVRRNSNFLLEYPLKLSHRRTLQRPKMITVSKMDGTTASIWSFSIDNGKAIFTEVRRQHNLKDITAIYGVNINDARNAVHLLTVNYKLEINLWNMSTFQGDVPKLQHEHRRHPQKSTTHYSATIASTTVPRHRHRLHPSRTTVALVDSGEHTERHRTLLPVISLTVAPTTVTTTTISSFTTTLAKPAASVSELATLSIPKYDTSSHYDVSKQRNAAEYSDEQSVPESNSNIEDTGVSPAEVCDELTRGCKKDKPKLASHSYACSFVISFISILIAIMILK